MYGDASAVSTEYDKSQCPLYKWVSCIDLQKKPPSYSHLDCPNCVCVCVCVFHVTPLRWCNSWTVTHDLVTHIVL